MTRIEIGRWRNLQDVTVELSAESGFLCLVGENGTGKSHLLDLLHLAAHHFGLTHQLTSKRQPPWSREEAYKVKVIVDLGEQAASYAATVPPELAPALPRWDGCLIFESEGIEKDPEDPGPPSPEVANSSGTSAGLAYWVRVLASGIESEREAFYVAGHVVQGLRSATDVLHLYIDAERVFPPEEVRDEEILRLARQDLLAPAWVRQQAAILTQNLYLEWMRAMLGQQQRLQSDYFQRAQQAMRDGEPIPEPDDFLDQYRQDLSTVLPHLSFVRLDQDQRRLIFDSAGEELPYEDLSGGERELAFLVGQIERFGIRNGLFLLDEPELHLNTQLLRGWLEYLRGAVETGQVWIAPHALEAAETAGLQATLVMERDDDRIVRTVAPLGDRPALRTLAGQLGSPAFSLARSRFLLIEGERPGRERERFARILDASDGDTFLESGGCGEVLRCLDAIRSVAWEAEQLQVGAFVDRDFRTDDQVTELTARHGVCVLPTHEIENFFLHPSVLAAVARQAEKGGEEVQREMVRISDQLAGPWIWERTQLRGDWQGELGRARGAAIGLVWDSIREGPRESLQTIVDSIPDLDENEQIRRRAALVASSQEYARIRDFEDLLWKQCFGKEQLRELALAMGFANDEALEDHVVHLWRSGEVARPPEIDDLRAYIDAIPVLT